MMEGIIDSLICSSCTKYLSVLPIKVYPNRSIKCGRCNSNEDSGTISFLYEMLAKNLQFPCINRYEGCTKLLLPDEMKFHESECIGTVFNCPVCCGFKGDSFVVVRHFEQHHPSRLLQNSEFIIVLDDKNEDMFYLYADPVKNMLAVIYIRYDYLTKHLFLDIAPIYPGHMEDKKFLQSFELFTVYKKSICKSSQENCTIYSDDFHTGKTSHILSIIGDYLHNVAVCKFFIQENDAKFPMVNGENIPKDVLKMEKHETPIITKEVVKYLDVPCNKRHFPSEYIEIFKPCTLDHVDGLPLLPSGAEMSIQKFRFNVFEIRSLEEAYSPVFYLANTSWRVLVKKHCESNTHYLSCFVEKLENIPQNRYSYKINAEISVLSFDEKNNITNSFSNRIFGKRNGESINLGYKEFVRWSILLDPNKKFLGANNDIEMEVNIKLIKVIIHKPFCHCLGCINLN